MVNIEFSFDKNASSWNYVNIELNNNILYKKMRFSKKTFNILDFYPIF